MTHAVVPQIALGLRALTCALKAKTGQLREIDRLDLMRDVMLFAAEDPDWRQAALAFETEARIDPLAAGRALLAWIAGPGAVVVLGHAQDTERAVADAAGALAEPAPP